VAARFKRRKHESAERTVVVYDKDPPGGAGVHRIKNG